MMYGIDNNLGATEEEFKLFIDLRNSGKINMNTIVLGSKFCGIPAFVYEDILKNFDSYCKKYPNVKVD